MSAVFGLFHRDGCPADPSVLARMDSRLAHRGPDGRGAWCEGPAALGHRLLYTTPESLLERLPHADGASGVVVTADVRIDNREELGSRLGLGGQSAATDADLVLAAYLRWGRTCVTQLRGDFAFAVWDPRESLLFCARDQIGVRPFYYWHGYAGGSHLFAFASEIGGLWALESIPRRPNEQAIADFLVPWLEDAEQTLWEGIRRLAPAHVILVRPSGVEIERYWKLDTSLARDRPEGNTDYVRAFAESFREAVRCRLRSVGPISSALSGGLDSSAVTGVAASLLGSAPFTRVLHTVSSVFPNVARIDARADERRYMEAVLKWQPPGTNGGARLVPHFVEVDRPGSLWLPDVHADAPIAVPNAYLTLGVIQGAAATEGRVLLSGFGGETAVSFGYELFTMLARNGRWSEFLAQARSLAQRDPIRPAQSYLRTFGFQVLREEAEAGKWIEWARQSREVSRTFDLSLLHMFRRTAASALTPSWLASGPRRNEGVEPWARLNRAILGSFARRTGLPDRVGQLDDVVRDAPPKDPPERVVTGLDEHVLGMYDVEAGRRAVDQRYPFYDLRVLELCSTIPFDQRMGEGWTRWILRRSMNGILPPEVVSRLDKGNIGAGIRHRLKLEASTVERLLRRPEVVADYVDVSVLRTTYARFLADPMKAPDTDVFTIFLSCSLALFLEKGTPA